MMKEVAVKFFLLDVGAEHGEFGNLQLRESLPPSGTALLLSVVPGSSTKSLTYAPPSLSPVKKLPFKHQKKIIIIQVASFIYFLNSGRTIHDQACGANADRIVPKFSQRATENPQ